MIRVLIAGVAVLFLSAGVIVPLSRPPHADTGIAVSGQAPATDLVNAQRAANGRKPLRRSRALDAVAAQHARDMARQGYFSHTSPDGTTPRTRARRAGYRSCLMAENISIRRWSEHEVISAWMTSPKHRKNMLLRKVTEFGIGEGPGGTWVMMLAKPGCR